MTRQYTPSNGTEGAIFEERWCSRCACDGMKDDPDDGVGCPILAAAYGGDRPSQWVQDVPDGPLCTSFREDVGQGLIDPFQAARDQERYDALPRCPVTGRPVIA